MRTNPVVLVNGNPESVAVWDLLADRLNRTDIVRRSPPGFGAPLSEQFPSTVIGYRDWLVAELEQLDGPVDLVGHDVGGSTVLGVAMTRPDLIRTWVSDSVGVFDPDYTWHDLARTWQTPGAGEASVEELLGGGIEQRVARMTAQGLPEVIAQRIGPAQGPEMGQAILGFYRSAAQPVMAELGQNLEAARARPGLAVLGTTDRFVGSEEMRRWSAARAGAEVVTLEGVGHWWMAQAPQLSAQALEKFWASA